MCKTINDNRNEINAYDSYLRISPNKNVPNGEAYFSYDMNYLCKYDWCGNSKVKVDIETLYYSYSKEFTITKLYTKYNFKTLTGEDYYEYDNKIYVSVDDYNEFFDKETYQSSVYVKDIKNIDKVTSKLNELGYKSLVIKDSLSNDYAEVLKVISIFKLVLTVILFIVLFFIAYFVIRLIQKSKNVYYSTVRILGGSKNVIRDFISIELLSDFNIAYLLTLLLVFLNRKGIIHIGFITDTTYYLVLKDFIIIYLILTVMSYFISLRYSRKLFKSSAMKTYNEEV